MELVRHRHPMIATCDSSNAIIGDDSGQPMVYIGLTSRWATGTVYSSTRWMAERSRTQHCAAEVVQSRSGEAGAKSVGATPASSTCVLRPGGPSRRPLAAAPSRSCTGSHDTKLNNAVALQE